MGKKKQIKHKSMERITSDIGRLLEDKEFNSVEEANEYISQFMGDKQLLTPTKRTKLHKAQDLIYDAWEMDDPDIRVKMAIEAIEITKDCADAYVILAEDQAKTWEDARHYYEKGVKAGERALGKKMFVEDRGHFWGMTSTRPYMRARKGLAHSLWQLGKYDEAIGHYKEMLDLNPSDNQGIRYILASCLAEQLRWDELEEHFKIKEYEDDCAADWVYTKALLNFVREGASEKANKQLNLGMKYNKHVPDYLTGKKIVSKLLPDTITMGGEDEAMCYAAIFLKAWRKVSGAIEWIKEQTGAPNMVKKVGRNELCPCGSGKKYKHCCGLIN